MFQQSRNPEKGLLFTMFTITFRFETGNPVTIDANPGEKLLDVARKANVAIDAPCSGNGVCGKCRVRLASGSLDAPINRHITQDEYDAGWRVSPPSPAMRRSRCPISPPLTAPG